MSSSACSRRALPRMMLPVEGGYRKGRDSPARPQKMGLSVVADKKTARRSASSPAAIMPTVTSHRRRGEPEDRAGQIVTHSRHRGRSARRHRAIHNRPAPQGLGGWRSASLRYVVRLEATTRRVVVGTHAQLLAPRLVLKPTNINWLQSTRPSVPMRRCAGANPLQQPAGGDVVEPLELESGRYADHAGRTYSTALALAKRSSATMAIECLVAAGLNSSGRAILLRQRCLLLHPARSVSSAFPGIFALRIHVLTQT